MSNRGQPVPLATPALRKRVICSVCKREQDYEKPPQVRGAPPKRCKDHRYPPNAGSVSAWVALGEPIDTAASRAAAKEKR